MERLDLQPWEEFSREQRKRNAKEFPKHYGDCAPSTIRGTGRTLRMLVKALSYALQNPKRVVVISGYDHHVKRHLRHTLDDIYFKLGFDKRPDNVKVKVETRLRSMSALMREGHGYGYDNPAVFVDHYYGEG